MGEYVKWDYFETLGISFNVESGRIIIFKSTLKAMAYPKYFHFLFTPEEQMFAIEPCEYDAEGAYRLPDVITREHYDLKSKNLVRFIFRTCGWNKKLTYRIPGTQYAPDSHLVYFDLRKALEVHEGRTKAAGYDNSA